MIVYKRMLHDTSIKWLGKVWPGVVANHYQKRAPQDEVGVGIAVQDMSYDPVEFPFGIFHGLQLRWASVHKDGFAILSTCRWLKYSRCDGV